MNSSVIVAGSLNIDHVVHAPRHPEIGETILGSDFHTFFGGKGANQAVAASRCGASLSMVGKVQRGLRVTESSPSAFGSTFTQRRDRLGAALLIPHRSARYA